MARMVFDRVTEEQKRWLELHRDEERCGAPQGNARCVRPVGHEAVGLDHRLLQMPLG